MNMGTPTGTRRLGLSRKRPSSLLESPCILLNSPATPTSAVSQEKCDVNDNSSSTPSKISRRTSPRLDLSRCSEPELGPSSSEREKHLAELEKRLATVNDTTELEKDIEMWRNACKESLIDLQASIAEDNHTQMSCKNISMRLGIWSVIKEQFLEDSEVMGSENEEPSTND